MKDFWAGALKDWYLGPYLFSAWRKEIWGYLRSLDLILILAWRMKSGGSVSEVSLMISLGVVTPFPIYLTN